VASRKPNTNEDLPDVSLQIPEETRPEVKALIKANTVELLSSKVVAQRVKAAQVLGELGEQGKPARAALCRAMLDSSADVRAAADDALKKIDPKLQYIALALATTDDLAKRRALLEKIGRLEEDVEPLVPLVGKIALDSAAAQDTFSLRQELTVLGRIGKKNLQACRLVASGLNNPDPEVRRLALQALARMKHGRLALPNIIRVMKTDAPENRVAAIEALTALADGSTEELLAAAIAGQRHHADERVRNAVDVALNKLHVDP
jgi:HEAT repeat protein